MLDRVKRRARRVYYRIHDTIAAGLIKSNPRAWPCQRKKYVVVGSESSGTTPISHLLFRNGPMRFLIEGEENWVWRAYMEIYQGHTKVSDYPRLQLFDTLKVPGFAAILDKYVEAFPNSSVVYVVRDPRDVICSAYRTWKVNTRDELRNIAWVKQTWLGIESDDPVERLALRWRKYLEASRKVPGVSYVRYEDFCDNKTDCIRDLGQKLGIPLDMSVVAERCDKQASQGHVRNYDPVGKGNWQTDEHMTDKDLQIIKRACGDLMDEWSYV